MIGRAGCAVLCALLSACSRGGESNANDKFDDAMPPQTAEAPATEAPSLSADAPQPQLDIPSLKIAQTRNPPRIDGYLSDDVWKTAHSTRRFVSTLDGTQGAVAATVWALWDARFIYIAAKIDDRLLRASHTKRDAHLWEQDCLELMIDPDGDGRHYMEIQISPRGVVFDTKFDRRRMPRPVGHIEWDSGVRSRVVTRGQVDDGNADGGYVVELALPTSTLGATPRVGAEWRVNIYLMDLGRERQVAAGWSAPLVPDFHVPSRFGRFRFVGSPADAPVRSPIKVSGDRAQTIGSRTRGIDVKKKLLRERALHRRQPGEVMPQAPERHAP